MIKPIIGITPSHNTENDDISARPTYLRALSDAGAIGILLPLEGEGEDWEQLCSLCDGILFSGGPDIHPFYFGEETQAYSGEVSLARDRMELELLRLAICSRKPVLGICRGVQTINIGLGGDIYQDLDSQWPQEFPVAHKQPFRYTIPCHHVDIREGTLLSKIVGGKERLGVNSVHHQAVRRLGDGLIASAFAPGGLVEAVEMPGYPYLLGIQWHPEYMWQNDDASRSIFRSFVKACGKER